MYKYLIFYILISIISNSLYSFNSKDINLFYNDYYSSNKYKAEIIKSKISDMTYNNIYGLVYSMSLEDDKQKYLYLKDLINKNNNYMSSNDSDYLISVAHLMAYIVYYSSLGEKIDYGKKSKAIYEKVLSSDKNNFHALLGVAIGYMKAPAIAGGSNKKALEYFTLALNNAKENYQKYLAYTWMSQYYFKLKDVNQYDSYVKMAESIYSSGNYLKNAINRNIELKKSL